MAALPLLGRLSEASEGPNLPAMLAGALPWFADERLGPLGVAGILLGIVGVGMLVGGSFGLFGQGAVMGAGGCWPARRATPSVGSTRGAR